MTAGLAAMQGWRIDMEVRFEPRPHTPHPCTRSSARARTGFHLSTDGSRSPLPTQDDHTVEMGLTDKTDFAWFAIFDGHGGSLTAKEASAR